MKSEFFVSVLVFFLAFISCPALQGSELFPFSVSFDAPGNVTDISAEMERPAGKSGFVRVENGHFATDAGRIRFWGTNMCFQANFPAHGEADRVAARLGRFGINCVRLHHMDARDIFGGAGAKSLMVLDPEQMDRLDYFVAALKKRGIYVNINLHVSRTLDERDGFPPRGRGRTGYDKGTDQFYRPLIKADKKYARDLLSHVNPYTGTAYKDEPAVAMVEINNENGLFHSWGALSNGPIPDPFRSALVEAWNDWLRKRYGSDRTLRRAWKCTDMPLEKELLTRTDFKDGFVPPGNGWTFQEHQGNRVELSGGESFRISMKDRGDGSHAPQLFASGKIAVKANEPITVRIRAKSDKGAFLHIGLGMNHAPWKRLSGTTIDLKEEFDNYDITMLPDRDESDTRLILTGFSRDRTYEIERVSMKRGGRIGHAPDRTLGKKTVPVVWKDETTRHPPEMVRDFFRFLLETEERYWQEMYRFLKEELGLRQPVSGTQMSYSSTRIQAGLDYCDDHTYWNHPTFTGKDWDRRHWYSSNSALVNHVDRSGASLGRLAESRTLGKPYTVSEYNHPFPNRYNAEGLPMIAAFGSFQDWDGIMVFAYNHTGVAEPAVQDSFFDTAANSVQLAHMIASSKLFRDEFPIDENRIVRFPYPREKEEELLFEFKTTPRYNFAYARIPRPITLTRRVGVDLTASGPEPEYGSEAEKCEEYLVGTYPPTESDRTIYYDLRQEGRGYCIIRTPEVSLFTGFIDMQKRYPLDPKYGELQLGETNLGWATVSISERGPNRVLLAATGEMTLTDMPVTQLEGGKITLGSKWGRAPMLCEGIPLALYLPKAPSAYRAWALDPSGNRKQELLLEANNSGCILRVGPEQETLWYEIEWR